MQYIDAHLKIFCCMEDNGLFICTCLIQMKIKQVRSNKVHILN